MLTKNNLIAVSTIIWGTLGAWLFGVPYAFAQAWVLQGTMWILLIGSLAIILNLLIAEVALSLPSRMRLPAMMQLLLPKRRGKFATIATCLQYLATMFAYISLSSIFVNVILWPNSAFEPAISATVYALIMGWFIYKWVDGIKKYDKKIVTILLCMLIFLIIYGFLHTTPEHFLLGDKAQWFLPYGVLIYALNNASTIPVSEEILWREKKDLPFLIVIAGLICMSMVLLWWWAVVGMSWAATSQDALSGLQTVLPSRVIKLGGLVWLFAIISPHFVNGEHLQQTLKVQFKLSSLISRTLVALGPLLLFLYLQADFVKIISISGAVFTGLTCFHIGVTNLMLHKRHNKKETHILPYNKLFSYAVIIIFSFGIIYELVKQFVL